MPGFKDELRDMAGGWRWGRRTLTPRTAEDHTPVREPWEFPTDWARTPAAGAVREFILNSMLGPLAQSETSVQVHGLDRLDGVRGPVLFFSNHSSHLDATLIMTTLPARWQRTTAVGAAKDYFFDVWWRQAFTALVYAGFPIDRSGGGRKATATAKSLLEDGWSIVVFPEGGRSPDGFVQRFRHGASRLAIETGVPLVPIGIRGAFAAMPKGKFWPKPGRPAVSIRYGAPIQAEPGETHQNLSRRMTQAVSQLLDEDESTWWEALRRAAREGTPSRSGPSAPAWRRTWEGSRPIPRQGPKRIWGA